MRSLVFVLVMMVAVGCSGGSGTREWQLPAELEGGWKMSVQPPNRETLELVSRLSPKKSITSGYEGPGKLLVSALELANGPAAFEQVQKWRAQPGKIVFYRGAWFVVVESDGLDTAQLSRIAAQIEKTMPE
jgi:hypothetical protein